MMRLLIVLTMLLVFGGTLYGKDYKIPEGKHYPKGIRASVILKSYKKVSEVRTVTFDSSAIYDFGDNDQYDINKLYGFADCGSHHHTNSVRIGWRPTKDLKKIELVTYVYKNGKRLSEKHLADVAPGKKLRLEITMTKDKYRFKAGSGAVIEESRGCTKKNVLGYRLYPYFGGNRTAPHDIVIKLEK